MVKNIILILLCIIIILACTIYIHYYINPILLNKIYGKYYFCHIPKNAGTSILTQFNMFKFNLNGNFPSHFKITNYSIDIQKQFFCIIRNPYDRMISLYKYCKYSHTKSYYKHLWHYVHYIDPCQPCNIHSSIIKDLSFEEFINIIVNNHKYYWTFPICCQTKFIKNADGNIYCKCIDFNNINSELSNIFNTNIQLVKENKIIDSDHTIYTADLEKKVYNFFKDDFDTFNFKRLVL